LQIIADSFRAKLAVIVIFGSGKAPRISFIATDAFRIGQEAMVPSSLQAILAGLACVGTCQRGKLALTLSKSY